MPSEPGTGACPAVAFSYGAEREPSAGPSLAPASLSLSVTPADETRFELSSAGDVLRADGRQLLSRYIDRLQSWLG
jgi:hypothetical protein